MKTYIKKINCIVILLFLFSACSDILNENPVDRYSDAIVWDDLGLVDAYLKRVYNQIDYPLGKGEMLGAMTDELIMARGGDNKPWNQGEITPDRLGSDRGHLRWTDRYSNIQRINLALSNLADYEGDNPQRVESIRGELLFLRAWVYHKLMFSYGGVPLNDSPSELGADYQDVTRATFEETVNFIVQDLDDAADILDFKSSMEMGRANKEAAMALKSRVLLFAASDLTAGPEVANELVGYTSPNREALWIAAQNAAKAVMDLGTLQLMDFGAPDKEAVADQYHAFFEATDLSNDGVIWGRMFRQDVGSTYRYNRCCGANGYNNWGRNGPMQQAVNSYQMEDGSDFFDHFNLTGNNYYVNNSSVYDTDNPYHFREPRFYSTVMHDSARYQQRFSNLIGVDPVGIYDRRTRWEVAGGDTTLIRFGLDTRNGPVEDWNANVQGYLLWKFFKRDIIGRDEANDNSWIALRYAEVLLNYAEASLELGDVAEATTYINRIRNRAAMPDFTGDPWDAYHYERKIELFGEDIRWYDIRRWRMLDELLPKTPGGIQIDEYRNLDTGEVETTWRHIRAMPDNNVVEKMYWIPIDSEEISRAPQLQQNPGY